MPIREPVAYGFYPEDKSILEKSVTLLLAGTPSKPRKIFESAKAAILPHAGYTYSGKTAALTLSSIRQPMQKTVVISGPNHTGLGYSASMSQRDWFTPLGIAKVNTEYIEQLKRETILRVDELSHAEEHSIEVQLPFLQVLLNDFNFLPVCLQHVPYSTLEKMASGIAKIIGEKAFYIASSDFTHFGSLYGYQPFRGKLEKNLRDVKKLDMSLVKLIQKLDAKKFYDTVNKKQYTVCGSAPITLTMLIAKELGAKHGYLVDYRTSYDVQPSESFVSYAGIVME